MRIWKRNSAPAMAPAVRVEDVRAALEESRPSSVVLGLERPGRPVNLDLNEGHVLMSAGAGSGKSVLMRSLLAQQLAHGSEVVILDVTGPSHRWAIDHPDVTYVRDVDEIGAELLRLVDELQRRMAVLAAGGPVRRLVVAIEARDVLVEHLDAPARAALETLERVGPAFMRMHVVSSVHRPPALAPALLKNYSARIVGRATGPQAWELLAGRGVPYPGPAMRGRPGRFWLVHLGRRVVELRGLFVTPEQARDLVAAVLRGLTGGRGAA